jgi:hypothetical protein
VTIPGRGTPEFWRLYRWLPADARLWAQKSYRLWSANAFHPSLHFKPIGKPNWSARVSDRYRVVGKFNGPVLLWRAFLFRVFSVFRGSALVPTWAAPWLGLAGILG